MLLHLHVHAGCELPILNWGGFLLDFQLSDQLLCFHFANVTHLTEGLARLARGLANLTSGGGGLTEQFHIFRGLAL